MGYNKKALSKIKADLNSAKGPAQPRDIIYDPRGQWRHPGKPTRIPGGNITMQDVPYPVMAYPNVGQPQIMYPNQDYQFPGADYVDEYPQMKKGGSKKYSRDITATNRLLMKNPLFKKRKSKKKKIFDPNSPYFQSGGYLPKAQKGLLNLADSKVEVVPFSYNYSNPQGQTIWGKPYPQEPTYRVGIEAPIRKPKEGYHTLNLDVGLPYSGKLKPSTELRYDWYNKPTLGSENIQLPYVQMTGRAGYDPVEKGFAGMSARTYYGFGTARPQTKSKPAQFRKNTWWSTLGPAFDFNLGDMQMVEKPESREKRFMIDPEWAYGVKGDVEYRPGKDKNLRLGARYAVMFDPVEGKNMEMLGYKPNSEDRLQFAVNPSLEVYGNYGVDLEPDFKKRTSGKLTDISKTTGTTTQNKNTGNTVVIDGIPVEVENTKETLEPCPAGYRRDRPDGECLPIERHHHPRWLKEGGKLGPIPLNSGRKVLRDWTYGKTIGMLQEQDGGVPYNTSGPVVEQERLEEYPEGEAPKIYGHEPEDYKQFLAYSETAPENRRAYSDYVYGDPDTYDQYGFWESIGKPKDWDAALKAKDESGEQLLYPDPYDNMYHGFSVNPNTGVFLKSGKPGFKEGDTTWMEIAGHYLSPRAQEDTPVFDPELGRFKYIPAENDGGYIETELTPEEIEVYRQGGYIVEDLDDYQEGGTKTHKSKDGTITNTIQNADGTQTIQVKKKDGSYFEKTIPVNYEKQLDKLKEEYKAQQDYNKLLNYAGVFAYPASVASSYADIQKGNYGDALLGLVPFIGPRSKSLNNFAKTTLEAGTNAGLSYAKALSNANKMKKVIPISTGATQINDVIKQDGGPIETELTPEEIEWYISQGYEVEELD